ncbi:unnamed protein product [Boreogadus saida]
MIRPSLDPADVFSWRLCWGKGPALYLAFPRGSAFKTFQTFQKGPALYLAFVFADAGHLWVFAVARLQKGSALYLDFQRGGRLLNLPEGARPLPCLPEGFRLQDLPDLPEGARPLPRLRLRRCRPPVGIAVASEMKREMESGSMGC